MRPFRIAINEYGFTIFYGDIPMCIHQIYFYPSIGAAMDALCNYLRALK